MGETKDGVLAVDFSRVRKWLREGKQGNEVYIVVEGKGHGAGITTGV